jgi:Ni/Fe-hydrogenase subunit HybB-like protein
MTDREASLIRSMTETSRRFYVWIGALLAVILWGLFAYVQQLRYGLAVTGMRDQISWGLYIINFVFFIGISHAGTLISAILRVTSTEWRRPITRLAEAITVFALCVGAPMVIIDLGRPDRLLNLFRYPRIQSPILWDVLSVTTYLTGSILYLYLPMIPDVAQLAGHQSLPRWRRRLYQLLSLGWTGSEEQQQLLEKAISTMAVFIIPLAVSVHTVVSWIFAMTLRPGWNSSIFGPYFVVAAIYSGAAAVVLSMYLLRRILHLERYLEPLHFRNLGFLVLAFSLLYIYFNINEYLTVAYKFESPENNLLHQLFFGAYAPVFWSVQTLGVLVPTILLIAVLGPKRYRGFTIPGVALASFLVVVGAWIKRYVIIVPTLSSPFLPSERLPWTWTHYRPTWVEWSITAAAVAVFLLIYTLFSKLFPMISLWETREGEAAADRAEVAESPAPRRWGSIAPIAILLLSLVLVRSARAQTGAQRETKKPQATVLSLEWQKVAAPAASASTEESGVPVPVPGRVHLFLGRLFGEVEFGPRMPEERPAPSAVAVEATLRDQKGLPLAFQAVSFALETSFGTLAYGSRPTNQDGKAKLVISDRRYGQWPVRVAYGGGEGYQPTDGKILVDFGARPPAALPRVGVLISPYPTAIIALPFLLFYGIMWVVFAYVFGFLILGRMRRSRPGPGSSVGQQTDAAKTS